MVSIIDQIHLPVVQDLEVVYFMIYHHFNTACFWPSGLVFVRTIFVYMKIFDGKLSKINEETLPWTDSNWLFSATELVFWVSKNNFGKLLCRITILAPLLVYWGVKANKSDALSSAGLEIRWPVFVLHWKEKRTYACFGDYVWILHESAKIWKFFWSIQPDISRASAAIWVRYIGT